MVRLTEGSDRVGPGDSGVSDRGIHDCGNDLRIRLPALAEVQRACVRISREQPSNGLVGRLVTPWPLAWWLADESGVGVVTTGRVVRDYV